MVGMIAPADCLELASVTEDAFRSGLRRLAAGVCVVTATHRDHYSGLTATSVMSVSLRPPIVAVSLNQSSDTVQAVENTSAFVISILSRKQQAVGRRFAIDGLPNKLDAVPHLIGLTRIPILRDSHAALECVAIGKYLVGDHCLYLGRVVSVVTRPGTEPLVYHLASYGSWAPGEPTEVAAYDACVTEETLSVGEVASMTTGGMPSGSYSGGGSIPKLSASLTKRLNRAAT